MAKVFDAAEGMYAPALIAICARKVRGNRLTCYIVEKHSSKESCWVILYGKVYDVCVRWQMVELGGGL